MKVLLEVRHKQYWWEKNPVIYQNQAIIKLRKIMFVPNKEKEKHT